LLHKLKFYTQIWVTNTT